MHRKVAGRIRDWDLVDAQYLDRLVEKLEDLCFDSKRHDEVEGINIDLRHKMLEARQWHPAGTFGVEYRQNLPLILFPWSKALFVHEEKFWDVRPKRVRRPEYIAAPGDRISIIRVERELDPGSSFLDQVFERERRLAYLIVHRKNGTKLKVTDPLVFRGVGVAFSEIDSVKDQMLHIKRTSERSSVHYVYAKRALDVVDTIDSLFAKVGLAREKWIRKVGLLRLGVGVGYYLAKATTPDETLDLVGAALRSKEGGAKGGAASLSKRQKMGQPRRDIAKRLIREIQKREPKLSQENLAGQVLNHWPSSPGTPAPLGEGTIIRMIRAQEKLEEQPDATNSKKV